MRRALILCVSVLLVACSSSTTPPLTTVGPTTDTGRPGFRLPSGWIITPVGRQLELADFPLNIVLLDNSRALVATSGYNAHELQIIDLTSLKSVAKQTVFQSWYGLATDKNRKQVWWSGGGANLIHAYQLDDDSITRISPAEPDLAKMSREEVQKLAGKHFRTGLFYDDAAKRLYSLDADGESLIVNDTARKIGPRTLLLGGRPYDIVKSRDGKRLLISDWAGKSVVMVDPDSLSILGRIPTGDQPNQMAVHPRDGRIFVACANTNNISVIDPRNWQVTETISTTLFPRAPEGSVPNALCLDSEGEMLYVTNAGNNCIAVIEVEHVGRSQVRGFIPTGWYPTSVALTPDDKQLLVGSGWGNQSRPTPLKTKPEHPGDKYAFAHLGNALSGALAVIPAPDARQLEAYTETVYRNCPYSDKLLTNAPWPIPTAIPTKIGDPSPIKHVLYIIKENRTYDQVLGDLPQGRGDPNLVMFGRDVTPNHHKLAEEFVLLDNLYCNGHVSADGHPWSTQAYNTDYIAKNWALTYSKRAGLDDDEEGNLGIGPSRHIWDAAKKKGLRYRNYGEGGVRVSQPDKTYKVEARDPTLAGHINSEYGVFGSPRDTEKAEIFLKEFAEFEKTNTMPHLMVMSLPENHTFGTKPGTHSPRACVASNDAALGRIVQGVSRSSYWDKIAIFVIEDDAQNGADHVDSHRTVGFVISAYAKRKHVDSTQYSTVSMLRTMGLILGTEPLSQHDAAANAMFASFADKPDLTPYTPAPASAYVNELNSPTAYGAERSAKMDFSDYDRIDDFELNEILWRSVKGTHAPLPPAVRQALAYRLYLR